MFTCGLSATYAGIESALCFQVEVWRQFICANLPPAPRLEHHARVSHRTPSEISHNKETKRQQQLCCNDRNTTLAACADAYTAHRRSGQFCTLLELQLSYVIDGLNIHLPTPVLACLRHYKMPMFMIHNCSTSLLQFVLSPAQQSFVTNIWLTFLFLCSSHLQQAWRDVQDCKLRAADDLPDNCK